MPTVLVIKGYRFFFYSNDHQPIHIHIEKGDKTAKFILNPIFLKENNKFSPSELREIRKLVSDNSELIKSKWNAFFGHR